MRLVSFVNSVCVPANAVLFYMPPNMPPKIFLERKPQSGHAPGHRNSPTTGTMRHTPKPASGNERAIKKGVQGALPPALFLPISRENGDPAGQAGNWALRPEVSEQPRPPKGYLLLGDSAPSPRPGLLGGPT